MPAEPSQKRTFAFVDGQNLFHAAKCAFNARYPNYDPLLLAQAICKSQGWDLVKVCFYTGLPDPTVRPFWHHFWTAKLAVMGTRGIKTFSRPLRYNSEKVSLPTAPTQTILSTQQKGI